MGIQFQLVFTVLKVCPHHIPCRLFENKWPVSEIEDFYTVDSSLTISLA